MLALPAIFIFDWTKLTAGREKEKKRREEKKEKEKEEKEKEKEKGREDLFLTILTIYIGETVLLLQNFFFG